jgi:hypothetical protein
LATARFTVAGHTFTDIGHTNFDDAGERMDYLPHVTGEMALYGEMPNAAPGEIFVRLHLAVENFKFHFSPFPCDPLAPDIAVENLELIGVGGPVMFDASGQAILDAGMLTLDASLDQVANPGSQVCGGDRVPVNFTFGNEAPATLLVDFANGTFSLESALNGGPFTGGLSVNGNLTQQPPYAVAASRPPNPVECSSPAGAAVVLDGSGSCDPDGCDPEGVNDLRDIAWYRDRAFGGNAVVGRNVVQDTVAPLGVSTYVLALTDSNLQISTASADVVVEDTTAPSVTCSVGRPMLRMIPKNNALVGVGFTVEATDACSGPLPAGVRVFADEDDEEPSGDGIFSPDAANIAPGTLLLRNERRGDGDGRVYLIAVSATDGSGNGGVACCTATVPHSVKSSAIASARAQAAAAEAYCLTNNGAAPPGYVVVGDGPVLGPKQ